jgi:chemotaxis methyl-accepting protein methylase
MSILHGTLQLLEPSAPRGLRLPIDFFFRHLAEDQEERAIGIILSGMGTDGTLGIKAIKEKLGMAMVEDVTKTVRLLAMEDVSSAKYDGMPRSAIATGLVDYIAPVKEMPAKLLGYTKHSLTILKEKPIVEEKYTNATQKITVLLRDQTGHDFSFYKKNTLIRRIERRMGVHQITNVDVYIRYLRENPQETELLFKELLIGVTSFFRDHEAFDTLREKAIPQMLKSMTKGNVLRVWSPGCSTGEEAYSVAIILHECLEKLKRKGDFKIQIFATDIDKDAINKARQGFYASNIAADVSPERLQRFFMQEDNGYRLNKEIREMVTFAPQNIIMDPPFSRLDLISCRNVLIYMTAELQKKLLPVFHYAVIINEKGDIVYITGRTGKYLEPAAGKTNMNIFAMAREGLRIELAGVIRRAIAEKKDVTVKCLNVKTNGDYQTIDLTVKPFSELEGMRGLLMIVFKDVGTPSKQTVSGKAKAGSVPMQRRWIQQLENELAYTKEHLQTTVEEMETSQEELKSANEELQSANEELQSTNEELTTSKEELQSMNEELVTVNTELQTKMDELARVNDDMKNLLNNIEIAIVFLDNDLNVRRFTPQATKIINLIPSDVGRPITHIVSNLKYKALIDDIKSVLQTLVFKETQVETKDGCWHLMRIMPYRTLDNIIGGVVVTFPDITCMKRFETSQRENEVVKEALRYAENIVNTVREPLVVLDAGLRVISANQSFYQTFQVTPEETEKNPLYELGEQQWNIPELRRLLEDMLPKNNQINDYKIEHEFPKIGCRVMLLNARRIMREGTGTQMILLAMEDITERDRKG